MKARTGAVDHDGVSIHYEDWGGDGPPLVLLHATGFLSALWRPVAEPLAERFRIVALDQRGHGDSSKPDAGYRFETFADDLQHVIDALGLERPIAAGHSSGATTIVMHAARHAGVLRRAVLIEPILPRPDWFVRPPGGRNPTSLAEGARKRRAVWPDRDEIFNTYRTRPAFESWREDLLRLFVDEGTFDRDDGQVELKCPPELEARFFEAAATLDIWPLLPDVAIPTLVLWGEGSHLHGRGLDTAAQQALPNANTVIVPETSHFLPQERPDEVSRLVQGFLAD